MVFDQGFEKMRLDKLEKQCLSGLDVSGKVIFGCIGDENRLDFSHWRFPDDICTQLNKCGYKVFLQRLLDDLIIYRSSFDQKNSRDGIVNINRSSASINWLPDGDAESMIENYWNTDLKT